MRYPWPSKTNAPRLPPIRTEPLLDADGKLRARFRTPAHLIVAAQAAAVEKRRRKRMTNLLASCAGGIGLTLVAVELTISSLIAAKLTDAEERALLFGTLGTS